MERERCARPDQATDKSAIDRLQSATVGVTLAPGEGDGDPFLRRAPIEEAGSRTAGWYDFQYGCALRHCLDMARPGSGLEWVLCEWHTDFALGWSDGERTLVSVKHRELDSGFWTVARLFSDGGLDVLFRRWDECGRPAECRWVTNGGLDANCRRLKDDCSSRDKRRLQSQARMLSGRFGADAAVVIDFLSCLRVDSDPPPARFLQAVDTENYVKPTLSDLQLDVSAAATAYRAALELVRAAAKGCGEAPQPWLLSSRGSLDSDSVISVEIARRSVSRQQIIEALRAAAAPAAAVLPPATGHTTRLARKLKAGDVVPTANSAARRARLAWTQFEREVTPPLPGDSVGLDLADLRARITSEAAESQAMARKGGSPYGDRMLTDLRNRVATLARSLPGGVGLDGHLLMGLVYDLTARCEVWWSPEFDPDAGDYVAGSGL